jgi:hypothetical protein
VIYSDTILYQQAERYKRCLPSFIVPRDTGIIYLFSRLNETWEIIAGRPPEDKKVSGCRGKKKTNSGYLLIRHIATKYRPWTRGQQDSLGKRDKLPGATFSFLSLSPS